MIVTFEPVSLFFAVLWCTVTIFTILPLFVGYVRHLETAVSITERLQNQSGEIEEVLVHLGDAFARSELSRTRTLRKPPLNWWQPEVARTKNRERKLVFFVVNSCYFSRFQRNCCLLFMSMGGGLSCFSTNAVMNNVRFHVLLVATSRSVAWSTR